MWINPDLLELILAGKTDLLILSNTHLEALHRVTVRDDNFGSKISFHNYSSIIYQCSLVGLDIELLLKYFNEIFCTVTTHSQGVLDLETLSKVKWEDANNAHNFYYFLYSHMRDSFILEYYFELYKRLVEQTNNLDPLELGRRIIILPSNCPRTFEGLEQMLEPLIHKDINIDDLDSSNMTSEEKTSFLKENGYLLNKYGNFEKQFVDTNCLTYEKLRMYKEEFNSFITVDAEHYRLYTRGRFLINFQIYLSDYIKESLVYRYNSSLGFQAITSDDLNTYLGERIKPIVPDYDIINLRKNVKLKCFYNNNYKVNFNLFLYEGNDRNIYVIIVFLDTDYLNFIKYFEHINDYYYLHESLKDVQSNDKME